MSDELAVAQVSPADLARAAEHASTAQASQAEAIVKAQYAIAFRKPRDMDDVIVRLDKECRRPGFAEVAEYRKPIGGEKVVTGASIRLIEALVRLMGNIRVASAIIFDDGEKRVVRVSATDLEANSTYEQDITIRKVVERSPSNVAGRQIISERLNSKGKKVFLVAATDEEMTTVVGANTSKVVRTVAERLIPGDIFDRALSACAKTRADGNAKDPDAAKLAVLGAFAKRGILPSQLKEFLGKDPANITDAEREELRGIITSLDDGDSTWSEVMEGKHGSQAAPEKPKEPSSKPADAPPVSASATAPEASEPKEEAGETISHPQESDVSSASPPCGPVWR